MTWLKHCYYIRTNLFIFSLLFKRTKILCKIYFHYFNVAGNISHDIMVSLDWQFLFCMPMPLHLASGPVHVISNIFFCSDVLNSSFRLDKFVFAATINLSCQVLIR